MRDGTTRRRPARIAGAGPRLRGGGGAQPDWAPPGEASSLRVEGTAMSPAVSVVRGLAGAWLLAWVAMGAGDAAGQAPGRLRLVTNGHSDYRIVVPRRASFDEQRAAEELQETIRQISHARLPIVTDEHPLAEHEIILGRNRHATQVGVRITYDRLSREGFTIRSAGQSLVIGGGPERGVLYGVYALLETYIGCRWFTPTASRIPSLRSIEIPAIADDTQVPAFAYRQVYYAECGDRWFCLHNRLNVLPTPEPHDLVSPQETPGNGLCHTFFSLCSPDKYFATHPEYFGMWDGQRTPAQLCLSNPEVVDIVVASLREAMQKTPQYRIWNVSQMDNGQPCTCPQCKALDDREGGHAATIINFVNQVAAHFPDKTISTLVYWYSMEPPKSVRPVANVQLIYCVDGDFRGAVAPSFEAFAAMAPELWTWYYCIPCQNIIAPWPNLLSLQHDMKYFAEHGARGIFVEGSYEPGSEFAELRTYLLAKLVWDQGFDVDTGIDEFLGAYYGAAAPMVREYIDTMYKALTDAGDTLDTHCWSRDYAGTFLAPAMCARYDAMFDRAEQAAAGEPELLAHVQHARAPLMHAEVQLGYGDVDARIALVERLQDISARTGIPHYADFNEKAAESYLPALLEGLRAEKAAPK